MNTKKKHNPKRLCLIKILEYIPKIKKYIFTQMDPFIHQALNHNSILCDS